MQSNSFSVFYFDFDSIQFQHGFRQKERQSRGHLEMLRKGSSSRKPREYLWHLPRIAEKSRRILQESRMSKEIKRREGRRKEGRKEERKKGRKEERKKENES